jgi:hypothetical protein
LKVKKFKFILVRIIFCADQTWNAGPKICINSGKKILASGAGADGFSAGRADPVQSGCFSRKMADFGVRRRPAENARNRPAARGRPGAPFDRRELISSTTRSAPPGGTVLTTPAACPASWRPGPGAAKVAISGSR